MSPRYTFDFDVSACTAFFKQHVSGFSATEDLRAIGLRRAGELVAVALYEGFNGSNMWVHVAAVPGRHWMVRSYLRACLSYPFEICKVERLSSYVAASNAQARRFNEHVGFRPEAVLRGAAAGGGDVLIYVMWKKDCRYVSMAQN